MSGRGGVGVGGAGDVLRYARVVLEDGPVGYWPGFWRNPAQVPPPEPPVWLPAAWQRWWLRGGLVEVADGRNGRFVGPTPVHGRGIDGLGSVHFASQPGQYVELPDRPRWSLMPGNDGLTVEAWLRLDRLEFADAAGVHTDYIHWLGKGVAGAHEWTFRLYSRTNSANRPNRLSFYGFNLAGGEGAGADAQFGVNTQVELRVGQWQHLVGTLSPYHGWPEPENPDCPREGVSLYQDGRLVDGVAAGDSNDSYWGFPDHAAGTLAESVAFPLVDGTLVLESAVGFRTRGTRRAVVRGDDGRFRTVAYKGVAGASLTGCSAGGTGSASAGALVRQGTWEIDPEHGAAPLRFGTRDLAQYLPGSLCHIAIYQKVLEPRRILQHYQAGRPPTKT